MDKSEQLGILRQGVLEWNAWRSGPFRYLYEAASRVSATELMDQLRQAAILKPKERARFTPHTYTEANLSDADLGGECLANVNFTWTQLINTNLSGADLRGAYFIEAKMWNANLSGANLTGADFTGAGLIDANLSGADLTGVELGGADLRRANFAGSVCKDASFREATLVQTRFDEADLTGAHIYGISAWDLSLTRTVQRDLVITPPTDKQQIRVDDLEVAQFIYLLLNNHHVRKIIDTITSKVVLILGRFTPERKAILNAIREELRKRDYTPVVFDSEGPSSRDLTETVSTLAHLCKFVIADITDAKSIPQELMAIVPQLPSVPVQPILLASERPWGMWEYFTRYPWVLPIARYGTMEELLTNIAERVIDPAERRIGVGNAR